MPSDEDRLERYRLIALAVIKKQGEKKFKRIVRCNGYHKELAGVYFYIFPQNELKTKILPKEKGDNQGMKKKEEKDVMEFIEIGSLDFCFFGAKQVLALKEKVEKEEEQKEKQTKKKVKKNKK